MEVLMEIDTKELNFNKIKKGLKKQEYVADDSTAQVLLYSLLLKKPLLIEGPAGAGKTELAKAWSQYLGRELIRLQCYEGIDENKALYEWDYQKQLLYIQTAGKDTFDWSVTGSNIYTDEFLLKRPLLKAITCNTPSVLLIDEIDKSDEEFESFLLEILSDWQVSIPEIGTIFATNIPSVLLTSNSNRNLSEALRRRCLYLYLDYPDEQRELTILKVYFPTLKELLGKQIVAFIRKLRLEKLKKAPSISEVIDWVKILEQSDLEVLTKKVIVDTVNVLLKHRNDCALVLSRLDQKDWYSGIFHT
jgi:MoxR-like ATPase